MVGYPYLIALRQSCPSSVVLPFAACPEPPFCSKHFDHGVLIAVEIEKDGLGTIGALCRLLRELHSIGSQFFIGALQIARGLRFVCQTPSFRAK
jgi:hypothetical protein